MRLPRLSLFSEEGSAPVDFVMVTIPSSLLLLPLIGLFTLWQQQITLGQEAYDLARFAALADVSAAEIGSYRDSKEPTAIITRDINPAFCLVEASITKVAAAPLWPEPIILNAKGMASCELD